MSLANSSILQLDTGAQAFATLNAGPVSNSTPAATLTQGSVDPNLLASTPDANTTDPFIQQEAAVLDYNAQNIFNFLQNDIGYNSYLGSLRGARGTLWSDAGNALDVASLGVALMRASGIPAQYVQGTLSQSQAQQLILSMFPASYQTVGYIPAGTQTSDPANDSQLLGRDGKPLLVRVRHRQRLGERRSADARRPDRADVHGRTGSFTEVAAEPAANDRGFAHCGDLQPGRARRVRPQSITDTVVLDQTFNDVDLVGRPSDDRQSRQSIRDRCDLHLCHEYLYTLHFNRRRCHPDPSQDETITGQTYQEVLTNFPLGTQSLTGLFLNVTLSGPQGPSGPYEHTLLDRIGSAARQGLAPPSSLSVGPNSPPAVTDMDITTIDALPGLQDPNAVVRLTAEVEP